MTDFWIGIFIGGGSVLIAVAVMVTTLLFVLRETAKAGFQDFFRKFR